MENKNLTMKLGIALLGMEVSLLDHVIIGDNYYSMADLDTSHQLIPA